MKTKIFYLDNSTISKAEEENIIYNLGGLNGLSSRLFQTPPKFHLDKLHEITNESKLGIKTGPTWDDWLIIYDRDLEGLKKDYPEAEFHSLSEVNTFEEIRKLMS